jgi:hypothetical protein
MNDFDELARQARLELQAEAERIADTDAALSAVRSGGTSAAIGNSHSSETNTRRWLAGVAAAMVLVTGGVVAVVTARARTPDAVVMTRPPTTPNLVPTTPVGPSSNAPPTTTASTLTTTTSPAPSTTGDSAPTLTACETIPLPPPFLVDGSDVGEPIIEELDDGRLLAIWGGGRQERISQTFGTVANRENFDFYRGRGFAEISGRFEMFALPVGDPPLGSISIFLLDTATDCFRSYFIAPGNLEEDANDLIGRWLAALTSESEPLAIPDEGLDPAPISSIGIIPLSQISLENGEFPHPVALLPNEIIVIEDVPFSDGLSGRAVALDRQTGEITRTLQIEGLAGRRQFGMVGSPDGQIIARLQVGNETSSGFASVVFAETSPGQFTIVGQGDTSEAIGDGAYRPAPVQLTADGIVEFSRYPAPGRPDAQADGIGRIERTEADGTTITWDVAIETNGSTYLRAEPFLDGALMVADDFVPPAGRLVADIAYLDPTGVRTAVWRVSDRWHLVDHDDRTVVFSRGTSEGLEIGILDVPEPVLPAVTATPTARRSGCPALELRDLPDGWAKRFIEDTAAPVTESRFQIGSPASGTIHIRLDADDDLGNIGKEPLTVDGYQAGQTEDNGAQVVEIWIGRTDECELITMTFESMQPDQIATALGAVHFDDKALTDVSVGLTTTTLFGRGFFERVDAEPFASTLDATFGPAVSDTGWQPLPAAYFCRDNSEYRSVFWGDLRVVFERTGAAERLTAWSIGDQSASLIAPIDDYVPTSSLGLISAEGIGPGTNVSVLDQFTNVGTNDDGTYFLASAVGIQVTSTNDVITGLSASRTDCQ